MSSVNLNNYRKNSVTLSNLLLGNLPNELGLSKQLPNELGQSKQMPNEIGQSKQMPNELGQSKQMPNEIELELLGGGRCGVVAADSARLPCQRQCSGARKLLLSKRKIRARNLEQIRRSRKNTSRYSPMWRCSAELRCASSTWKGSQ